MKFSTLALWIGIFSSVVVTGCVTKSKGYTDANEVVVVGTKWSDSDNQIVAEAIVKQALAAGWFAEASKNGKPKIGVSKVRNLTSEEIDTDALVNYMKNDLINSGKVTFVANQDIDRGDIEKEMAYQQGGAVKKETRAKVGQQTGVGYLLRGDVSAKNEMDDNVKMVNYQVNFRLINLETSEEIWSGQKRIRKQYER